MTHQHAAAVDRYHEFQVEHYTDSWAIFGKDSDYPIATGLQDDMTIIADLLNTRARGELWRTHPEHSPTCTHDEGYCSCGAQSEAAGRARGAPPA